MDELLIPEDLRAAYREATDAQTVLGVAVAALIERIARAETKVAELEAELANMRTYSHETVRGLVDWRDERIKALEAENGRLRGLEGDVWVLTGALEIARKRGHNVDYWLMEARAQQPSPQEKEKCERINKGRCAAQVVDCDCFWCSPAQEKEQS